MYQAETLSASSILCIRTDPQIEVFGETRFGVLDDRISADYQIPNVVVVEKSQQICEVGVDEHRCLSPATRGQLAPRQQQNVPEEIASARIPDQKTCPAQIIYLCVP